MAFGSQPISTIIVRTLSATPAEVPAATAVSGTSSPDAFLLNAVTSPLVRAAKPLLSLFTARETPGLKDLDTEITKLESLSRTSRGDALETVNARLDRLLQVKGRTQNLMADEACPDAITIRRPDVALLKETARDKLLAGAGNPPDDEAFEEGTKLYNALELFSQLERSRNQIRTEIESLYPEGHPEHHFRLDGGDLVQKTYLGFRDSEKPEDRRIAANIEKVFKHFENENANYQRGIIGPPNSDPVSYVNYLNETLEGLQIRPLTASAEAKIHSAAILQHPDLALFFDRHAALETEERQSQVTDEQKVQLRIVEGLQTLDEYPEISKALNFFSAHTASSRPAIPLEVQQVHLKQICEFLVERGERCRTHREISDSYDDSIQAARDCIKKLTGPVCLTQKALNQVAAKLLPVADKLQAMEEAHVRCNLQDLVLNIIKAAPHGNHVAIEALMAPLDNGELPENANERFSLYRQTFRDIAVVETIRSVESTIAFLNTALDAELTSRSVKIGCQGSPLAGEPDATDEVVKESDPYLETLSKQLHQYQEVLTYLKTPGAPNSKVPADQSFSHGMLLLKQITDPSQLENLETRTRDNLALNYAATIFLVTMASFALTLPAIPLAGGAAAGGAAAGEVSGLELGGLGFRALFARMPLSLGAQRFFTTAGTYGLGALSMTVINRQITSGMLGDDALPHGFAAEFAINLAFMGAGGAATKGTSIVIDQCAEAVAIRNIASRGGSVALVEGRAAVAPGAMNDALRSVIDAEKEKILSGTFSRLAQNVGYMGAEFAAMQTLECLKTAAILAHNGVRDPLEKAFEHITSPSVAGQMLGPMLVGHFLHNGTSDLGVYASKARAVEFGAVERKYNAKVKEFEILDGEFKKQWFSDDAEGAAWRKAKNYEGLSAEILGLRKDMIALMDPTRLTTKLLFEHEASRYALGQKQLSDDFGVLDSTSNPEEKTFTYDRLMDQKTDIASILKDMPWIDHQSVRIYENGKIEAQELPGPFTQEPKKISFYPRTTRKTKE